jgi:hypothetical protein
VWSQASEVEIVVVKLEKYKLPGSDQVPAQLIEKGDETLLGFTNSLIWNKEEYCCTNLQKGR